MKYPSIRFALIALATGIMASGLIGVCTVDGETLTGPYSHEFQEQRERILPAFAHTDSLAAVVRVGSIACVEASLFDTGPDLISGRNTSARGVTVRRWPVGVTTLLTLCRTTASEVAATDDGLSSAVTATVPEIRLGEAQYRPLAETLPGQIDNPFLVGTVATHWRLACGKVRAEQFLFDAAVAAAKPVLADYMRNDGVLTESFTSQIIEPFRACHLMSPWKEWLSSRTKNIPQHNMLQVYC